MKKAIKGAYYGVYYWLFPKRKPILGICGCIMCQGYRGEIQ